MCRETPNLHTVEVKCAQLQKKMDTTRIVDIHSVIILRHSDKTKDRVEISPEQLSAASIERSAEETGHFLRVVGWYHPCPHDTIWPPHIDVRTQAMYQMMDQGIIGLIFACFIGDKTTKTDRALHLLSIRSRPKELRIQEN